MQVQLATLKNLQEREVNWNHHHQNHCQHFSFDHIMNGLCYAKSAMHNDDIHKSHKFMPGFYSTKNAFDSWNQYLVLGCSSYTFLLKIGMANGEKWLITYSGFFFEEKQLICVLSVDRGGFGYYPKPRFWELQLVLSWHLVG